MKMTEAGLERARIRGRDAGGYPLVAVPSCDGAGARVERARLAIGLTAVEFDELTADGTEVLLARTAADGVPVILGVLRDRPRELGEPPAEIVLEARERLVVRCGSARIVLSGDGRIEVLGERVSQRARGVHSIKGAAVRIN